MTRLPQTTLHFNRQLKLSNDGGELSSDTGKFLFREFDEKIGFSQTIAKHLHLKDERSFCIHQNEQLLRQKIYQLIAGYHEDDAADQLTHNPVFTQVLGTPALASQPSLSHFSPEGIAEILQEYGFEDVARKCTVDTLLHYLVGAAVFKWESMPDAADRAPAEGLARVNYSTLSKRLKALDFHIIKQILHRLIRRLNRAARRALRLPKELLAIGLWNLRMKTVISSVSSQAFDT